MAEPQTSHGFQLPTPGPMHALLKPFSGTFKGEVKVYMGAGEPMVSTGKMINTFQVNGLFLHQDYQGDQVDGPFPRFVGRGYWGFNTTTNQYQGFWVDCASTSMQLETGSVSADGKVFEMSSEFMAPGSGMKMKKRSTITVIDNDRHRMEAFITPPGAAEMKHMEIEYSRI